MICFKKLGLGDKKDTMRLFGSGRVRSITHPPALFSKLPTPAILSHAMSKKKRQQKNIVSIILIVLLALIAYGIYKKNEHRELNAKSTPQQEQILSEHLQWNEFQKMAKRGDTVVIDIRTPEEIAQGTLFPNVKNINYYDPHFEEQVAQLDPSKTYLIYCRSGHRSGNALPFFKKHGLKVYDLKGGYNAVRG